MQTLEDVYGNDEMLLLLQQKIKKAPLPLFTFVPLQSSVVLDMQTLQIDYAPHKKQNRTIKRGKRLKTV